MIMSIFDDLELGDATVILQQTYKLQHGCDQEAQEYWPFLDFDPVAAIKHDEDHKWDKQGQGSHEVQINQTSVNLLCFFRSKLTLVNQIVLLNRRPYNKAYDQHNSNHITQNY